MVRLRVASAALAAAALLGACDEDPEPRVQDPTPSVTSEPTASASDDASPPAELDPEQTVRAWVHEWNAARISGDTSAVRAFEDDECAGCDELLDPAEDILKAGGTFVGGEWSVVKVHVTTQTENRAEVGLAVNIANGSTTPSIGASPTPYPASKHLLKIELVAREALWRISDLEILS